MLAGAQTHPRNPLSITSESSFTEDDEDPFALLLQATTTGAGERRERDEAKRPPFRPLRARSSGKKFAPPRELDSPPHTARYSIFFSSSL